MNFVSIRCKIKAKSTKKCIIFFCVVTQKEMAAPARKRMRHRLTVLTENPVLWISEEKTQHDVKRSRLLKLACVLPHTVPSTLKTLLKTQNDSPSVKTEIERVYTSALEIAVKTFICDAVEHYGRYNRIPFGTELGEATQLFKTSPDDVDVQELLGLYKVYLRGLEESNNYYLNYCRDRRASKRRKTKECALPKADANQVKPKPPEVRRDPVCPKPSELQSMEQLDPPPKPALKKQVSVASTKSSNKSRPKKKQKTAVVVPKKLAYNLFVQDGWRSASVDPGKESEYMATLARTWETDVSVRRKFERLAKQSSA